MIATKKGKERTVVNAAIVNTEANLSLGVFQIIFLMLRREDRA
jgi:hypothetical protein